MQLLPSLTPSGGRDVHAVAATAQRVEWSFAGALSSGGNATLDLPWVELEPAHGIRTPRPDAPGGQGDGHVARGHNQGRVSVNQGVAADSPAATCLRIAVPCGPSSPRWDRTPPAHGAQTRGACHTDEAVRHPYTLPLRPQSRPPSKYLLARHSTGHQRREVALADGRAPRGVLSSDDCHSFRA